MQLTSRMSLLPPGVLCMSLTYSPSGVGWPCRGRILLDRFGGGLDGVSHGVTTWDASRLTLNPSSFTYLGGLPVEHRLLLLRSHVTRTASSHHPPQYLLIGEVAVGRRCASADPSQLLT